jgi:hypothetical protein
MDESTKAKQQREIAACAKCGRAFTRIRQISMFLLMTAESWCPRCRCESDMGDRQRAYRAARQRWETTIAANDRAVEKCLAGKFRFVDTRSIVDKDTGKKAES